jgi:hypothetical protein
MQRAMKRIDGESDAEYEKRMNRARYGLEGEDRVNFHLNGLNLPVVCLSDVRIETQEGNAQADFIVLSKAKIFIIEVKNLYGNVRVNQNGEVIRIIPRKNGIEEEGMPNPFTQTKRQMLIFQNFLAMNGYYMDFDYLIVMGNPHTAIYFEKDPYPIIRYDNLRSYFETRIDSDCSSAVFTRLIEIGEFIKSKDKTKEYYAFDMIHKKMMTDVKSAPIFKGKDLMLYEEILEFRRKLAQERKLPVCNIFLNRDAEWMVKLKPRTPDELMSIPGIKYRKYMLFGEAILAIIRKYQ